RPGRPGIEKRRPGQRSCSTCALTFLLLAPVGSEQGYSNNGAIRHGRTARNDHNAVADDVVVAFRLDGVLTVNDTDTAANAAILVEDGPLDHRAVAHTKVRKVSASVGGALSFILVFIGANDDAIAQADVAANSAANADDAPMDF